MHGEAVNMKIYLLCMMLMIGVLFYRLLTVEEKERLQKEEKLNKADKNIALAIEELNNYR